MESTNGAPPPIVEEARKVICRVPPEYQSAELRVIFDAARFISRDKPLSHVDSRILHCADRLPSLFAESEPDPPTPFDSRIAAALAEEAEKEQEWEKAKEERFERALDVDALTGSGAVLLRGSSGPVSSIARGRFSRELAPQGMSSSTLARAGAR